MKHTKESILEFYIEAATKLGKMPSFNDCKKLGLSTKTITYHFGTLASLKAEALDKAPYLEHLAAPRTVSLNDIDSLSISNLKKDLNKKDKKVIETSNIMDFIAEFSDSVFKGRIQEPAKVIKKEKMSRIHTLILSDLHFGADIDGAETTVSSYGTIEEARRFAAVIKQASEYKPQYRNETKLVIACLGDFIENSMHDARTGANTAEQCSRAIHLMIQGIAYLANSYGEVEVYWMTGNHDRITSRHHSRAVHQKFDSFGTIIGYAIKSSLSNYKNITFTIPKSPMSSYMVFGKRIGITHADTVINPGGIYSSVNVKNLENQINKINASLEDKDEYSAVLYGHTHIGHTIRLSNGCTLIGNGGLPPPDPFSVSLGNFESNSGQWIFESVADHPVGDMRYIRITKDYDKDASLDKIIKPWKNF
jgi:hypothetical protein